MCAVTGSGEKCHLQATDHRVTVVQNAALGVAQPRVLVLGSEDHVVTVVQSADAGVARPRVLVSGSEGSGQDHLAPALLHALEGLPVHSIGLPALLSDASARYWQCYMFLLYQLHQHSQAEVLTLNHQRRLGQALAVLYVPPSLVAATPSKPSRGADSQPTAA